MPFETEGGGGGGSGGGGGGAPSGTGPGGSQPSYDQSIGRIRDIRLLSDPLSVWSSMTISSTDDEGAFAQRSTNNTTTLFWTSGSALKFTVTSSGNVERQMLMGSVMLVIGSRHVFRARIYTDDNVPVIYAGLFNTNATTALLSSITDGVYFKKAGSALTTTCCVEYDNNGEQSDTAGLNVYLDRFFDLTIEIVMSDHTSGAGHVTWRIDGHVVHQEFYDASTAAKTLPFDEPLFPTFVASGTGVTGLMSMSSASVGFDRDVT